MQPARIKRQVGNLDSQKPLNLSANLPMQIGRIGKFNSQVPVNANHTRCIPSSLLWARRQARVTTFTATPAVVVVVVEVVVVMVTHM